jgi:hypothetical protein
MKLPGIVLFFLLWSNWVQAQDEDDIFVETFEDHDLLFQDCGSQAKLPVCLRITDSIKSLYFSDSLRRVFPFDGRVTFQPTPSRLFCSGGGCTGGFMINFNAASDTSHLGVNFFTRAIGRRSEKDTLRFEVEIDEWNRNLEFPEGERRLLLEYHREYGFVSMHDLKSGTCLKLLTIDGVPWEKFRPILWYR